MVAASAKSQILPTYCGPASFYNDATFLKVSKVLGLDKKVALQGDSQLVVRQVSIAICIRIHCLLSP